MSSATVVSTSTSWPLTSSRTRLPVARLRSLTVRVKGWKVRPMGTIRTFITSSCRSR